MITIVNWPLANFGMLTSLVIVAGATLFIVARRQVVVTHDSRIERISRLLASSLSITHISFSKTRAGLMPSCWGDGRVAMRITLSHPDGELWSPCGDACVDFQNGKCNYILKGVELA